MQLNVDGFVWDCDNQQVNCVGLDLNGQVANFTQNIGSSLHRRRIFLIAETTAPRTFDVRLSAKYQGRAVSGDRDDS